MKVLTMYEYPPVPAGLSTQGDLLYHGLLHHHIDTHAVHYQSQQEKEWYYRWFAPDVAVGIGFWGFTPDLILHPQRFNIQAVPWLVADGYIANYRETLNELPLILVTSTWVKEVYRRDGIRDDHIEVLPVGCNTDLFHPRSPGDPQVEAVRASLGIAPDELMILTVGGDAASKGGREVMRALALIKNAVPKWKYVCKVWPQQRTELQNLADRQLAEQLGIASQVIFATSQVSRNFMPCLLAACDIYAGPSRLEGFGMPQIEAGACGKPVVAIDAMAFRDTLVHGETAFLAGVAHENTISETILADSPGFDAGKRIVFDQPRTVDYRASVSDIADYLQRLLQDDELRKTMGAAGRLRVAAQFDYRVVAMKFLRLVSERLNGSSEMTASPVGKMNTGLLSYN